MRRLARLLVYITAAAVVLALGQLHATAIGLYDFADSYRFTWSLAYIGLLCVAAYGVGLPDLPRNVYQALWSGAAATVGAALAISFVQLVLGSQLLPRFVVFWSVLFLIPLWALTGFIAARDRRRQGMRDRVVLVAEEEDAQILHADLERNPERRAVIAQTLAPAKASTMDPASQPLVEVAVRERASVVVLARQAQADESIVQQAAGLHAAGVRIRTLSLFYDEWLGKLPMAELERIALMFDIGEVHRQRYGRVKRGLDIGAGLVALAALIVATPFVVLGDLVANRGPLLFRQARVGKNDDTFVIYKFRTMRVGDDTGSWTAPDDPRITPFGKFLRVAHIDELPQAINLLRGDLSIVGPRPEQVHYVADLTEKIRFYSMRHLVRPGVTGWAQVKYDYGATEQDALEKLQYEFWYLRHQGLSLDVRIIGRTLRSVLLTGGR